MDWAEMFLMRRQSSSTPLSPSLIPLSIILDVSSPGDIGGEEGLSSSLLGAEDLLCDLSLLLEVTPTLSLSSAWPSQLWSALFNFQPLRPNQRC